MNKAMLLIHTSRPPRPKPVRPAATDKAALPDPSSRAE